MGEESWRIIQLDSFEAAPDLAAEPNGLLDRRYRVLLEAPDNSRKHGGSGNVQRVANTFGQVMALKSLKLPPVDEAEQDRECFFRSFNARRLAFDEEYLAHCRVAGVEGFPALYGHGTFDGGPVILMEWIDGVTSLDAFSATLGESGRTQGFPGSAVAELGIATARALLAAQAQSPGFTHRDISPRNIMLRCDRVPLREQFASGSLDVCIVDMGSANLHDPLGASGEELRNITLQERVWRFGTAEYAPPEMVTNDVAGVAALRMGATVDVYALCCVLYELYGGRTPYEFWKRGQGSLYRTKMDEAPAAPELHREADAPLVQAILWGIQGEQNARPSMAELEHALCAWLEGADPSAACLV